MDRVTLRVPKQQIEDVEALVENGEFPNRSEAVRTAIRELIDERREKIRRARRRSHREDPLRHDGGRRK